MRMGALLVLATLLVLLALLQSAISDDTVSEESVDSQLPPDTFRKLAQALYQRGEKAENRLQRKFFYNDTVTCNDGSVAGFYLRRNYRSARWIIFLEGGWICHDDVSCGHRGSRQPRLLSSSRWPSVRTVGGVLSSDPQENPHFHEANHVFVPYCSSDAWSGTRRASSKPAKRTAFMGSLIVEQVIRELADFEQLLYGDELYLAGSSAGATGVLVNVDHVADMVAATGLRVRGIVDSGWFLDSMPFREPDMPHNIRSRRSPDEDRSRRKTHNKRDANKGVSVVRDVQMGLEEWEPRLPPYCLDKLDSLWQCFLGYKVFPLIRSPLFIFQWQFDSFQMYAANVASPSTRSHWNHIHGIGRDLRASLNNVSAVFAPACIAHEVITKSEWTQIEVDDTNLPDALHCWAQKLNHEEEKGQKQRNLPSPTLSRRNDFDDNRRGFNRRKEANQQNVHNNGKEKEESDLNRSSMQMDSPLLASNLVRSMRRPSSRNSLSHRFGRRRGRRGRRRGDNRRVLSNTTDELDDDSDASAANNSDHAYNRPRRRKNADLVRSLDRRSSRHSSSSDTNTTKERSDKQERRRRRRERQRLRRARKQRRRRERRLRRRKLGRKRRQKRRQRGERGQDRERPRQRDVQQEQVHQERPRRAGDERHHLVVRSATSARSESSTSSATATSGSASTSGSAATSGSASPSGSCKTRLIDRCTWPHCNRSCPKLKNPETGQEIDFLALLRSFGLNMGSVAHALGVDMATLNHMDREVLVQMLTSHASNVDLGHK